METTNNEIAPLKFSLKRKTLIVEIDDKPYTLSELTGAQRDAYLNDTSGRMRIGTKGEVQGIKNFDGIQTKLLSMSLSDSENKLVDEKLLKTWPASVLESLYEESQKLSGLNRKQPEAEEAAKND